jgi:hypothetical protein
LLAPVMRMVVMISILPLLGAGGASA